jgi:hypothetical protein
MGEPASYSKKKSAAISSLRAVGKSLSWETLINYLASKLEKLIQIVVDHIPLIATAILTLSATVYAIFIKFTKTTYTITGAQILIGIFIFVIFVAVFFSAPKIRQAYIAKHDKYKNVFGLDWRMDNGQLIGPYCPHCNKGIISEAMLMESMNEILNNWVEGRRNYTYICLQCNQEITLDGPLEQMKEEVYKLIQNSPSVQRMSN